MNLLNELNTGEEGFWNAFLFVDGRTEKFHTEKYCAYTLITVPIQSVHNITSISERKKILFKLYEERHLFFPLNPTLSFIMLHF